MFGWNFMVSIWYHTPLKRFKYLFTFKYQCIPIKKNLFINIWEQYAHIQLDQFNLREFENLVGYFNEFKVTKYISLKKLNFKGGKMKNHKK